MTYNVLCGTLNLYTTSLRLALALVDCHIFIDQTIVLNVFSASDSVIVGHGERYNCLRSQFHTLLYVVCTFHRLSQCFVTMCEYVFSICIIVVVQTSLVFSRYCLCVASG